MSDLRATKLKGWYEYTRQTCPICSKTGGCMVNEKGNKVVCIREVSEIVFSENFQSWLHHLENGQEVDIKKSQSSVKIREKLDAHLLDYFFRRFQDEVSLSNEHQQYMMSERKMTNEELDARAYSSFPKKTWETAAYVFDKFKQIENAKLGVPGFYKNQYGWSIAGSNGIMIPYRNEYNEVVGYQIRVDNPLNDVAINKDHFPNLQARVKQQPNLVQIHVDGEVIIEKHIELNTSIKVEHEGFVGEVKLVKGQRYFWLSSSGKNEGTGAGGPTPIHVAVPTSELKAWELKKEQDKDKSEYTTLRKVEAVWITEGARETCSSISLEV